MKSFLLLAPLLFLAACSAVQLRQPTPPRKLPQGPDITTLRPTERQSRRELGSLWSESSSWNTVYSTEQGHQIGEIVSIKLDAKLRAAIQRELESAAPPPPVVVATPGSPSAADAARRPAAAASESGDSKFRAIIQSIPAKGIYRVTVADLVKVGGREPYIYLEGNLREEDLEGGKGVSSDSLLNVRLEVYGEDEVKAAADFERK